MDVRSAEDVERAVDQAVEEFNGRLDIFVANAGIPWQKGAAVDGPLDHYRDVIQTDLDGTYYCAKAAAKHWRRQRLEGTDLSGQPLTRYTMGSFIATASMSGVVVNIPQLQASYNAAKAGVIHLVKSLAVEWAQYARANSVSPGYMNTEISDFVPQECKEVWKDKTPLGYVILPRDRGSRRRCLRMLTRSCTAARVSLTSSRGRMCISAVMLRPTRPGRTSWSTAATVSLKTWPPAISAQPLPSLRDPGSCVPARLTSRRCMPPKRSVAPEFARLNQQMCSRPPGGWAGLHAPADLGTVEEACAARAVDPGFPCSW